MPPPLKGQDEVMLHVSALYMFAVLPIFSERYLLISASHAGYWLLTCRPRRPRLPATFIA